MLTERDKMLAKITILKTLIAEEHNVYEIERLAKEIRIACADYLELQEMHALNAN